MDDLMSHSEKITCAEAKILELIRLGMTNREIASELRRSEFTVKTHVQRILAKTGSKNRAQACALLIGAPEQLLKNTPFGVLRHIP